jgi:hypothetical protein
MALMLNDFYRFRSSIIGKHFGSAKQFWRSMEQFFNAVNYISNF